jgi:hypothetical protein
MVSKRGGCCGWLIVALVLALVATAAVVAIMKRKPGGGGGGGSSRRPKPLPVPGPPGDVDSKYGDSLGIALQFFQVQKGECLPTAPPLFTCNPLKIRRFLLRDIARLRRRDRRPVWCVEFRCVQIQS